MSGIGERAGPGSGPGPGAGGAADGGGGGAGAQAVPAPDAPLGASDPTRRWALSFTEGAGFPGLTRPECSAASRWLAGLGPQGRAVALVPVVLPVVLSDGAGPHLLDSAGRLVLALGGHPALPGLRVAMGRAGAGFLVGAVRPAGAGWVWTARALVDEAGRVPALDALAAAGDAAALRRWADGEARPHVDA